jgi:hypothetical protein
LITSDDNVLAAVDVAETPFATELAAPPLLMSETIALFPPEPPPNTPVGDPTTAAAVSPPPAPPDVGAKPEPVPDPLLAVMLDTPPAFAVGAPPVPFDGWTVPPFPATTPPGFAPAN